MNYQGTAKLDRRTKNLVKRLQSNDIAIIDHEDLDRVAAESLIDSKVKVVINTRKFSSGRYPNMGPILLAANGIYLVDNVGQEIFNEVHEGEELTVDGERVFCNGKEIARGEALSLFSLRQKMEEAKKSLDQELEKFAANTLNYLREEKKFLLEEADLPFLKTQFKHRHALVVVRGSDYKADLQILRSYIREMKPVLIGVDGGADALLAEGYKPHIIIGDMDSVSDEALQSGSEVVVHAYPNGNAPGLKRIEEMGLSPAILKAPGTSEDIAFLLAYEKGAELIVAVGSHANLIEFLEKGREGMASTFLVRLKVGSRLVDAKGVNKLYQSRVRWSHLLIIVLSALITVAVIIMASPSIRNFLRLILVKLQLSLGL